MLLSSSSSLVDCDGSSFLRVRRTEGSCLIVPWIIRSPLSMMFCAEIIFESLEFDESVLGYDHLHTSVNVKREFFPRKSHILYHLCPEEPRNPLFLYRTIISCLSSWIRIPLNSPRAAGPLSSVVAPCRPLLPVVVDLRPPIMLQFTRRLCDKAYLRYSRLGPLTLYSWRQRYPAQLKATTDSVLADYMFSKMVKHL